MKIYVSENRIVLFTLCSAFVYTFLYFPFLGWRLYSASTMLSMLIVIVYVCMNIEMVLNFAEFRAVNLLACAYFASEAVSKLYNQQLSILTLISFVFQCTILPFIEIQRHKGHINFLYKVFLLWFGAGLLVSDVLMVIMPGRFFGDGISKNFFLGNKFQVGYDHIMLLMMFCMLYSTARNYKKWLTVMAVLTASICYFIDCRTTVLGTIVLFLVTLIPEDAFGRLCTKKAVFVTVVMCAMFVFFVQVTQIPSIKYFITEVLGRDVTLTGRQQIFAVIPKVLRRRPWLGYGSSSYIISKYTGAFNAQNGFFDLAICNGIPSAILYVILLVTLIPMNAGRKARILLGGIYAYLFMSTVEVTYGTPLILFGILLLTEVPSYRDENVRILEPETLISVRVY